MPDPTSFTWNEAAGRYQDAAGRFVSRQRVRSAFERAIVGTTDRVGAISEQLRSGRITLRQWHQAMRNEVKNVTLYTAAMERGGWAQLRAKDSGRVGSIVKAQYKYLDRFAGQIASGEVRLDGRFLNRARLYPQSGRQTSHLFGRVAARDRDYTHERSSLASGESCQGCLDEQAKGWVPIGELVPIGSRQCSMNCHCSIEYKRFADSTIMAQDSSAYTPLDPDAFETFDKYFKNGVPTAERKLLHDAIVRDHFKNAKRVRNPTVRVLGGGPAAGKTSSIRGVNLGNTVTVDVDHVRTMLPEYREAILAGSKHAAALSHEEASYIAKRIGAHGVSGRFNLLMDGTGDGSFDNLKGRVDSYRGNGAKVIGSYTTVDTDKAMARMIARGNKTGRYVPETYLRDTHKKVSQVFPQALEGGLYDYAELWDTNGETPVKVLTHADGKTTIHDVELWKRFLEKGK